MSFTYGAVFLAGLATFLSPCVLPLIPVLTASLLGSDANNRWGRLLSTVWFGLGFTLAFVLAGMGLSAALSISPYAKVVFIVLSAIILGFFGLKMAGVLDKENRISIFTRSFQLPAFKKKLPFGMHGIFFGGAFGLSWTPCVGPILGGVLTYVASQERPFGEGVLLLTSFSSGIVLPLLIFASASDYFLPKLRNLSRFTPKIESLAGFGLILLSVYMLNQAYMSIPLHAETAETDLPKVADASEKTSQTARMLFFYSDSCPFCRAMEEYLPEFEAECVSDTFRFKRVNVGRRSGAALAARFNVRVVPTISVLNANGQEIMRLVGYQSEARLREAARAVVSVACSDRSGDSKFAPPADPAEVEVCSTQYTC